MFIPLAYAFLYIFDTAVNLYSLVVFLYVISTWLIPAGILDIRNPTVRSIVGILTALTEPVLRRMRRFIPPIGGIDLSPIILLVGMQVIKILVDGYVSMAAYRL